MPALLKIDGKTRKIEQNTRANDQSSPTRSRPSLSPTAQRTAPISTKQRIIDEKGALNLVPVHTSPKQTESSNDRAGSPTSPRTSQSRKESLDTSENKTLVGAATLASGSGLGSAATVTAKTDIPGVVAGPSRKRLRVITSSDESDNPPPVSPVTPVRKRQDQARSVSAAAMTSRNEAKSRSDRSSSDSRRAPKSTSVASSDHPRVSSRPPNTTGRSTPKGKKTKRGHNLD